jgi:glycine/D-amino acid oxidase-like deaminating enzyme
MADKLFSALFQFYKKTEELLGQRFFYPMPIYRPFISIEEQNEWMAQSEGNSLKKFISKIYTSGAFDGKVNDSFGGVITEFSGYLNTVTFMEATRRFLNEKNAYLESCLDFEKAIIQKEKIIYENIEASKIIFCDGIAIRTNPYFNWVPVHPLKGETLTISLHETPDVIFNRGVYVVPTHSEKLFMVGATYNPKDSAQSVSIEAKKELEEKLRELIRIPFTINHQNWGIRPTSPDRKPIIGSHPEFENLIIFNGLGTKGVSLAPYFSGQLAAWLEGHGEIVPEVNIERFKSLYSKFSSAKI